MEHPGGTLLAHLRRVSALLSSWGARPALVSAGPRSLSGLRRAHRRERAGHRRGQPADAHPSRRGPARVVHPMAAAAVRAGLGALPKRAGPSRPLIGRRPDPACSQGSRRRTATAGVPWGSGAPARGAPPAPAKVSRS
ncbi:DUF6817 domain-containing protein [Streptomyces sp. KLMMK]|uniref:DUF6817 domain-containing protein n=1 Tax=Streptomyces sp. KLMMK TaxID=3109353 RepID=UPI003FA6EE7A